MTRIRGKKLHIEILVCLFVVITLAGCHQNKNKGVMGRKCIDPHSYSNVDEIRVNHISLNLYVSFEKKELSGNVELHLQKLKPSDRLILDTKGLLISSVSDHIGEALSYSIGKEDSILGRALTVNLKEGDSIINISYKTTIGAEALQWLEPVQTFGKHPFLFTQSQAILARSWIPLQDTPKNRFTFEANLKVPEGLLALMSARNPTVMDSTGNYHFEMPQPISSYLMSLVVGKLEFREISENTGVYAEPAIINAAAYEFAELGSMLKAAEELYGKYRWERYDLVVLPKSFPFGGMENPRITFVTPTIITGDRSLTSLVAHELAHSWSGNLVTNASWNDFWLNEGFTVYFERRIMEKIYGKEYAEMLAELGQEDLLETINELKEQGQADDTRLKLDLEGRNPDDGLTDVAYEKGYFFLRTLEAKVGRQRFDVFLNSYFDRYAFQTIDTEDFMEAVNQELELDTGLIKNWIFGQGLPDSFEPVSSARFLEVDSLFERWCNGENLSYNQVQNWSAHEYLYFIRRITSQIPASKMELLDRVFRFSNSGNSEILAAWLERSIETNYDKNTLQLSEFLIKTGRRKFLIPIYTALLTNGQKDFAMDIYKKARPNYHYVSTNSLDLLLEYK